MAPLEAALARHRAIAIAALATLTLLAWVWLLAGAGTGMAPMMSLTPPAPLEPAAGAMAGMAGMTGMAAERAGWPVLHFALIFSMWWVMMVAMMLPSAAPTILLYGRAARHRQPGIRPATGSFLAGYLLVWGAFSLAATALQFSLERASLLSPMAMALQSRLLPALVLIAAGLYQLSPLKDVCLRHCRNPAQFLSHHHRPGAAGAWRMGIVHGAYCVGCCWILMALLFVGGVMNLVWIALLTAMVAAEKLLPFGRRLAIVAGLACIAGGLLLLR